MIHRRAGEDRGSDGESLRRWRLILGPETGEVLEDETPLLDEMDMAIERSLDHLYHSDRRGGLRSSAPSLAGWLDEVRSYFPSSTVCLLQLDAIERFDLAATLAQPELLDRIEPDVRLAADLLALTAALPERTQLRPFIERVVDRIERQLLQSTHQSVTRSLGQVERRRRPRWTTVDWQRTIEANLKHYQPDYGTLVLETLVSKGRSPRKLKDLILCLDSSGSMAASAVYTSILASALASVSSLRVQLVAFDTSVVDLTEALADPVAVLLGLQLGGGTDIARALAYCQQQVDRPQDTILVLISDLYEGGDRDRVWRQAAELVALGVQVVTLLALDDAGTPSYDGELAQRLAELGIPCLACTPDRFPELMAAAIQGRDLRAIAEI